MFSKPLKSGKTTGMPPATSGGGCPKIVAVAAAAAAVVPSSSSLAAAVRRRRFSVPRSVVAVVNLCITNKSTSRLYSQQLKPLLETRSAFPRPQ